MPPPPAAADGAIHYFITPPCHFRHFIFAALRCLFCHFHFITPFSPFAFDFASRFSPFAITFIFSAADTPLSCFSLSFDFLFLTLYPCFRCCHFAAIFSFFDIFFAISRRYYIITPLFRLSPFHADAFMRDIIILIATPLSPLRLMLPFHMLILFGFSCRVSICHLIISLFCIILRCCHAAMLSDIAFIISAFISFRCFAMPFHISPAAISRRHAMPRLIIIISLFQLSLLILLH